MDNCPHCEYHKERALRWRIEAYKLAGYPLPTTEPAMVSPLEFVATVYGKEHLVGKPIVWAEWPMKEKV